MDTLKEHYTVAIIGGGPKGLVLQHELEEAGMNSILIEAGECGRTWNEAHMNKKIPITPPDLEISNLASASFQDFLRTLSPAQLRRDPLIENLYPTVGHLRRYLKKLRQKIKESINNCLVTDIIPHDDTFRLETTKGQTSVRNVVLSTGLVGYGNTEFKKDPTGLLGETPHVQHQPATLRRESELANWVKGCQKIAIIGAGPAAFSSLTSFNNLGLQAQVHVIEIDRVRDRLLGQGGTTSQELQRLAQHLLPDVLKGNLNLTFHDHSTVKGAEAEEASVQLYIEANNHSQALSVDRVLLCTGFEYNFAQLPFTQRIRADRSLEIKKGFPVINPSHQVMSSNGPLNLYMLGAGASHLGHQHITLKSTPRAVNTIISSIKQNTL